MATELQKKAYKIYTEKKKTGKRVIMAKVMREAGYSNSIARNPLVLTESRAWQILRAKFEKGIDENALSTILELSSEKNEDKDNRLRASVEGLKLNDRYPKQQSKVIGLFGVIKDIGEEDAQL